MAKFNFFLKSPLKPETAHEVAQTTGNTANSEIQAIIKANKAYNKEIAGQETLINLFVSYNDKRMKVFTGEKIKPINWDKEKQRPKRDNKLMIRLNELEAIATDILTSELRKGVIPTEEQLRDKIKVAMLPVEAREGLISDYLKYLVDVEGEIAPQTIKVKKQLYNYLQKYQGIKKVTVGYEGINDDFYKRFTEFLRTPYESIEKSALNNNTAGKQIAHLKAFMRYAVKQGWTDNGAFKDFKVTTSFVDAIHLSKEELLKLYALDLSKRPELANSRDLFILGCTTGLRYSDFSQIKPENFQKINGNEYIRIVMQKTKDTVSIPLHPFVKQILKKRQGKLPQSIQSQPLNRNLKELGKLAGIDEAILHTTYIGTEKVQQTVPKYELLVSHTGRRTFATNLYFDKVPAMLIMKITGHKSESSFLKYIKITDANLVQEIVKTSFFEMKPKLKVA
jgi:integrase